MFRPSLVREVSFRLPIREDDQAFAFLGSADCTEAATSIQAELNDRSLCPWYWNLNFDPNRIPAILPEAVCKCKSQHYGDLFYECHEMKYQVRVLKFGKSCDEPEMGEVAIGMACVAVRTAQEGGFRAPLDESKAVPDQNS